MFWKSFQGEKTGGPPSSKSVCPNCSTGLERPPKRKAKCPSCKKPIYVRTKQRIFRGTLLRERDAIAVDALKELEYLGIGASDYSKKERELEKSFEQRPSSRDVMWGVFNNAIVGQRKDYHTLKSIYMSMARFQRQLGEDFGGCLTLARKMELLHYDKTQHVEKVQVLTMGGCDECRKLHGRAYLIKEALKEMPLPCPACTSGKGFCICCYAPHVEYDAE